MHCCCLVTKSCPSLLWPLGLLCLGSFQARILEWVAISFFRRSSRPRDLTHVSYFGRCILLTLSHQGSPVMSNIVVVQSLSCVQFFGTPWTAACQASPVLRYLPEFAQTHVHWVSDAIQPSHPLSPPSLALNLSQHQSLFQRVSFSLISGDQSIGASASVLPMNIQGWFPLGLNHLILAVPGTLKSLLQHQSSKVSVFLMHTWYNE